MTETIVLHYIPISQPARACWAFIRGAGLDFVQLKEIDFLGSEHKSADCLEINRHGTVPGLEHVRDDGTRVGFGESHAIMRYLANVFCNRVADHWYPTDAVRRARADEYLDWHHGNTRRGVPHFFYS